MIYFKLAKTHFFWKTYFKSNLCVFFRHFLAFFDTFTNRYNHSDIKLKFSDYFYSYKHFIKKSFLKMIQKCPSDLCALCSFFLISMICLLENVTFIDFKSNLGRIQVMFHIHYTKLAVYKCCNNIFTISYVIMPS
jgi:hypothetical protein